MIILAIHIALYLVCMAGVHVLLRELIHERLYGHSLSWQFWAAVAFWPFTLLVFAFAAARDAAMRGR